MLTRRPYFFNNTFNNTKTHNNMATATCPEIKDFLAANECLENFGGLGVNVYAFIKADLKAPLKAEKNVYPALTSESFNTGKGLYKFQCKENSQGHTFESLGRRKGFKQQLDYVLESVNAASAEVARGLNNLDLGYIVQDGEKNIIVYDEQHKFEYASGGIKGDTGKKADDDRQVELSGTLQPTAYGRYEIATPDGGWDSLLASKKA